MTVGLVVPVKKGKKTRKIKINKTIGSGWFAVASDSFLFRNLFPVFYVIRGEGFVVGSGSSVGGWCGLAVLDLEDLEVLFVGVVEGHFYNNALADANVLTVGCGAGYEAEVLIVEQYAGGENAASLGWVEFGSENLFLAVAIDILVMEIVES